MSAPRAWVSPGEPELSTRFVQPCLVFLKARETSRLRRSQLIQWLSSTHCYRKRRRIKSRTSLANSLTGGLTSRARRNLTIRCPACYRRSKIFRRMRPQSSRAFLLRVQIHDTRAGLAQFPMLARISIGARKLLATLLGRCRNPFPLLQYHWVLHHRCQPFPMRPCRLFRSADRAQRRRRPRQPPRTAPIQTLCFSDLVRPTPHCEPAPKAHPHRLGRRHFQ
jgi:hypothetical protein